MITDNDRNDILYFVGWGGSIERWYDWKDKKAEIEKEYPELIAALNNLEEARKSLRVVLNKIESDIKG